MSAPGSPQLKEVSVNWMQLSTLATAKQTEERRKYGQTFTTSAALVDDAVRSRSLPSSPFQSSARHEFTDQNGRERHCSLKEPSQVTEPLLPSPLTLQHAKDDVEVTINADEPDGSPAYVRCNSVSSASDNQKRHHADPPSNYCSQGVVSFRRILSRVFSRYGDVIRTALKVLLFVLFAAYLSLVVAHDPHKGTLLLVVTGGWMVMSVYGYVRDFHGNTVAQGCAPLLNVWTTRSKYVDWVLIGLLLIGVGLFLGLDIAQRPIQLRSLIGMVVIITFSYVNSTNPGAVRWRPVVWGIGLQLVMGVIVLRWRPGYQVFFWISSKVQVLLNYADFGAKFVFGDPAFMDHPIAFKVIPMVVFFSALTNMMFYLGAMQVVISKMSWLMQNTMQTTTIESLSVAGNVFFTLTEEAFILRPYMPVLTMSELHAVMTGGSATVAGFALAMYIELGAPPIHVFSAAVMSAPAALAIAKLSYPETEESHTKTESDVELESGKEGNVLEAAAAGATMSIKVISYAIVIIIAFFGLLALINDLLSYFGDLVGHPELSFTLICSYVFFPVAWIMGVPVRDCRSVASIMGMKYFGSDLIAYGQLGDLRNQGLVQERSVMITTYAVLGFSSLSSVGVNIGILGALCPGRRKDVSSLALRAILNGNLASMLTACLAGLLNYS